MGIVKKIVMRPVSFYSGEFLNVFLQKRTSDLITAIEKLEDDYVSSADAEQICLQYFEKYSIDIPLLHFENIFVIPEKKQIEGSRFSPTFNVNRSKKYTRDVLIFSIPYSGDIHVLEYRPSTAKPKHFQGEVDDENVYFEVVNFSEDTNRIEIENLRDREQELLFSNYQNVVDECTVFNAELKQRITDKISKRKEKIRAFRDMISSLGVPIRTRSNVPNTFAIPRPIMREKIQVQPMSEAALVVAEYYLDNENYFKILKIISDVGKNFERLPSVYKGKDEETLRDHFLLVLDPNFEIGNATGETFNKSGKTDISLRYDSGVVFIAECKFWSGEKGLLNTIDQLLGYLTWRDSKTAVIKFVKNKDFSSILAKTRESIRIHQNFIKELSPNSESWMNYEFHLNGDKNRLIKVAVILFHLPE